MPSDFVELSLRAARSPGISQTSIPALQIIRADRVLPRSAFTAKLPQLLAGETTGR